MGMAGPEAEKQEGRQLSDNLGIFNQKHSTDVLPWEEITKLIDKHMDEKDNDSRMHQFDNVDRPMHYAAGTIECIDAIEAQLSAEEFRGYLKGNIIKYLWREKHKGGIESLKKAKWYLNKLLG